MNKKLLFLFAMLFAFSLSYGQYKVLVVDDDANGSNDESFRIDTALAATGYNYSHINLDDTTVTMPSFNDLKAYDMVIWYTGNDGVSLNLWNVDDTTGVGPSAVQFNDALQEYVDSGYVVWIDGLDYLYDIYGSAPDDFSAGDFVYDAMGIDKYVAQSKADDSVYTGVPMMLKAASNSIINLDTITWKYSTLWYADAMEIVPGAVALYTMGPADYDFAGKVSAFYYNNLVISSIRVGVMGDGTNYAQDMINTLVGGMVAAAENGTFVKTTSISTTAKELKVKLFPNPAHNTLNIRTPKGKDVTVNIFDITGKVVFSDRVSNSNGLLIEDISALNAGMYFYKINIDGNSAGGKFSVVK